MRIQVTPPDRSGGIDLRLERHYYGSYSDEEFHLAGLLRNPIHRYMLLRRSGFEGAGASIELRPVPEALNRAADHDAAGRRSASVRASIIEGDIPVFGAREHDTFADIAVESHLQGHAEWGSLRLH